MRDIERVAFFIRKLTYLEMRELSEYISGCVAQASADDLELDADYFATVILAWAEETHGDDEVA